MSQLLSLEMYEPPTLACGLADPSPEPLRLPPVFCFCMGGPGLTTTAAALSAAVDTPSLMLQWVVAWLAAARLPLTGVNAMRNLVLTLTAAIIALLIRILALREALIPLGWFEELALRQSIQLMLPRNLVTFAVLWIGGWALIHYRHSSELALRAATLRLHLVRARLTGLMSRLQPHFVGNALHAVSALIYDAPQSARSMLADLRDVIASALEKNDTLEVQLSDELHFLNRWLDVQSQRFAGRLHCSVNTQAAAREAWVPRLILRPLVENVIKHAVGKISPTSPPGDQRAHSERRAAPRSCRTTVRASAGQRPVAVSASRTTEIGSPFSMAMPPRLS